MFPLLCLSSLDTPDEINRVTVVPRRQALVENVKVEQRAVVVRQLQLPCSL